MQQHEKDLGRSCRRDFPVFKNRPNLVYLDSGATSQKPQSVLDATNSYYALNCANVHRGVYEMSAAATELYEVARRKVASFINSPAEEQVIFTRGATESINLVAYAYGSLLKEDDEIVTTVLEHHSNFVPWQQLALRRGFKISYVGLNPDGTLSLSDFASKLTKRTRIVAVSALANGLGIEIPVAEISDMAHRVGAVVVADACQVAPHKHLDVQTLGADFVVFSAHKMYGPTGVGVLWGRKDLLEQMPPFLFGGDMISAVSVEQTTFNVLPYKFEAGTPNVAGVIGLGAAVDYISGIGREAIQAHEDSLVRQLEAELAALPGVQVAGAMGKHSALVCFTVNNIHPHDISQHLDARGIAVRAGHHCAQPLLKYLGLTATTRASVGVYNTPDDIAAFGEALRDAIRYFS